MIWYERFEAGAELVGHAQDKLLAITFEVVVRDGGGKRPGGVRHANTSIAGEAGNEEGEVIRVAGEDADKDGGCHDKFIDLRFRDLHINIR